MYRKYRIVECIASSVSQYESYRDQVYRYTPKNIMWFNYSSAAHYYSTVCTLPHHVGLRYIRSDVPEAGIKGKNK